jgi:hypothetical protein
MWQISVSHLLQRHRPRSLSLEQTLGSPLLVEQTNKMGVASQSDPYTKVFRLDLLLGQAGAG